MAASARPSAPAASPPPGPGAGSVPVALVTGAGRRLGRAIALGLAQAGYDLLIHYNSSVEDARDTALAIEGLGRRAMLLRADLAVAADCERLMSEALPAFGRFDCLVNSAARFEFDDPGGFNPELLAEHLGPNLVAPLVLTRELARHCTAHQRRANVINILDQKLDNLNPDFFSYTLTKAALRTATTMMAMSFAPLVRVNAVSPGATLLSWKQDDNQFEQSHQIALLGRSSRAEDIAAAVCYLAGAEAVTGVNLVVDGGQHLMALDRDVMFLTTSKPTP